MNTVHRRNPVGLFIAGTDTGVGKTWLTAFLARHFVSQGKAVGVYKPVASGCRRENGEQISDDAVALWEAAGKPGALADVCPQRFLAPLAPNVAARQEGALVDEPLLIAGLERWKEISDIVLIEGAGGLLSPLSDGLSNADLAAVLGYPLLIVAANRLGVINHARLTVAVAGQQRERISIAAVILNDVPGVERDESRLYNLDELRRVLAVPVISTSELAKGTLLDELLRCPVDGNDGDAKKAATSPIRSKRPPG